MKRQDENGRPADINKERGKNWLASIYLVCYCCLLLAFAASSVARRCSASNSIVLDADQQNTGRAKQRPGEWSSSLAGAARQSEQKLAAAEGRRVAARGEQMAADDKLVAAIQKEEHQSELTTTTTEAMEEAHNKSPDETSRLAQADDGQLARQQRQKPQQLPLRIVGAGVALLRAQRTLPASTSDDKTRNTNSEYRIIFSSPL